MQMTLGRPSMMLDLMKAQAEAMSALEFAVAVSPSDLAPSIIWWSSVPSSVEPQADLMALSDVRTPSTRHAFRMHAGPQLHDLAWYRTLITW